MNDSYESVKNVQRRPKNWHNLMK